MSTTRGGAHRLVLFDIDGTLLLSRGAGARAVLATCEELFERAFARERDTFAGRLDPRIFESLCHANGVPDPERHHDRFRRRYAERLAAELGTGSGQDGAAYALAGVPELLEDLDALPGVVLGLLTGNYRETGRMKVAAAGLDPDRFVVGAWGTDGRQRAELPPVAMRRYSEHAGRAVHASDVVVVGDTRHDVTCAHVNGCRSLAVATGSATTAELRAAGADLVVDDLSATATLVRWIVDAGGRS